MVECVMRSREPLFSQISVSHTHNLLIMPIKVKVNNGGFNMTTESEIRRKKLRLLYSIKEVGGGSYGDGFFTALDFFDLKVKKFLQKHGKYREFIEFLAKEQKRSCFCDGDPVYHKICKECQEEAKIGSKK